MTVDLSSPQTGPLSRAPSRFWWVFHPPVRRLIPCPDRPDPSPSRASGVLRPVRERDCARPYRPGAGPLFGRPRRAQDRRYWRQGCFYGQKYILFSMQGPLLEPCGWPSLRSQPVTPPHRDGRGALPTSPAGPTVSPLCPRSPVTAESEKTVSAGPACSLHVHPKTGFSALGRPVDSLEGPPRFGRVGLPQCAAAGTLVHAMADMAVL